MSCIKTTRHYLETIFDEVWKKYWQTPNFKQFESQDVTILEEYVGTIAKATV
jgi:hypothetical protein